MKRIYLFAHAAILSVLCAFPAAAQEYANLGASMFGEYIGSGGDDEAEGDFNGEADLSRGRLCYYLDIEGLDDATGIAIHSGETGEHGPEVLPLSFPADPGDEACVTADAALLRTISEDPNKYYLIVRSGRHPDGAIRSQLHD